MCGIFPRKGRFINIIPKIDLSGNTSQLHGSEAEGPKQTRIGIRFGPSASLPCSCDVITRKVY